MPCALLLSRQNVNDLPSKEGSTRLADAAGLRKGGYIAADCEGRPDIICLANGSEVGTLYDAAVILAKESGVKARIVSMPSTALFLEQPEKYRVSVIPEGVPVFALSAGLPNTLLPLVGPCGRSVGLERFGASAPYKVLDEKFGYTPAHAVEKIREYLGEYPAIAARIRNSLE
jgi:transketolase